MATREDKLRIVQQLKAEIQNVKEEIETKQKEEKKRQHTASGTLMRTGILLFLVSIGIGVIGYFWLR